MKQFKKNSSVRVGAVQSVPLRYQGRTGTVVGTETVGRGFRYLIDFGGRRANPLPVASRFLTVA